MFPVSLLSRISREEDYVPYVARQNYCVQIMGNHLRRQIGLRGPLPLPVRGIFADEGRLNLSLPKSVTTAVSIGNTSIEELTILASVPLIITFGNI